MKRQTTANFACALTAAVALSACAMNATPPVQTAAKLPPMVSRNAPRAPSAMVGVQAGIPPGSLKDFEVNVGDEVRFSFDSTNLDNVSRSTLQKQAAWLAKYRGVTVVVQGNCDERGTREYNVALGARRAETVKDYLETLGVAAPRLATISYGKEHPVCAESNETCWALNRRAVSVISNVPASANVAMGN